MPASVTLQVWSYEELSDRAKEKARDVWREGHLEYEWWEFVYDDAKQCAEMIGIDIDDIWFSGFCSQGDGACWVGTYSYAKGGVKAIKSHAPQDEDLHEIAETLQAVQQPYFYTLAARSVHRGHYHHQYTMDIEADSDADVCGRWLEHSDYETLRDALRDFAGWIYRNLEKEHDWQLADEQIEESIIANEGRFNEDGSFFRY